MEQFELTLLVRKNDNSIDSIDTIKADDLVHLLSQLMLVIVGIQKRIQVYCILEDDDIPF